MVTTHIYFEGGTRNGTTEIWNMEPGTDVHDDNIFRPPELYRRTTRSKLIGNVEFTVFRYDPAARPPGAPAGPTPSRRD
ncbi:hypothetical protein [Streptomyces palmae]|uniref:Uncharacterized protein n=1 Tax=Streptomyces palmae TaxID=1701085 RepID=A0A4Z0H7B2_9ACTN|nr:hypothetical protein [Streptomyces palmae]TGB09489.1 hypothetical protein E4099_13675 [Streptomyces palmae]